MMNNFNNDFNCDITVNQFLNKLFLMSFDWFYCYVNFPEDKFTKLGGKWECSPLIRWKDRDEKVLKDFMNFWGTFKVHKVEVVKPGNGMYLTGAKLDGMGMVIYVDYEEGKFI